MDAFINENGYKELGIGGDFTFNPITREDGYGVSAPLTLSQITKQADSTQYFSNEVPAPKKAEVQTPLVIEVDTKQVAPVSKPVASAPVKVVATVPMWAHVSLLSGVPAGLIIGAAKGRGFIGCVAWGIIGGVLGALPTYYYQKQSAKK